jgi:hypothetical protein
MDKPLEPGVRKKGRNTFKVSQEYLKEDLQKLKNQKISKEKPVKAVAGVLAGLAAGVAPGIIGVGMLAKKKMKKKSNTVSSDDVKYTLKDKNMLTDLYQKATKQEATKMNKGGGMDMGQMPNTVKPRPRGNPGIVETVVGKGGDYIKDLID